MSLFIFNPRHACAVRVTVLSLCVCLCLLLNKMRMKVENFKRFSLKMLCCEARAFPVGTAYGYMTSQPFFTLRKKRMRI